MDASDEDLISYAAGASTLLMPRGATSNGKPRDKESDLLGFYRERYEQFQNERQDVLDRLVQVEVEHGMRFLFFCNTTVEIHLRRCITPL